MNNVGEGIELWDAFHIIDCNVKNWIFKTDFFKPNPKIHFF